MSWPSLSEFLVIALLLVLFFGAKRLPGLGESLGKSLRNFKEAIRGKEPKESGDGHKPEEPKNS